MSFEEITFKADKKHRDKYFSAGSFAHPAKMMLPLQRWLIEKYSKPGDVILDPMAGQGTLLIACTTGRHVIMVELEAKFVQMQRDNWAKIQTLGPEMGYEMGTVTILQGDARKLPDVLADVVITSPPYADARSARLDTETVKLKQAWEGKGGSRFFDVRQGDNPDNISNLPYGKLADVIMTSPPYEGSEARDRGKEQSFERELSGKYPKRGDLNISKGYQGVDVVISSPPYEDSPSAHSQMQRQVKKEYFKDIVTRQKEPMKTYQNRSLPENQDNIGNLKGESYLSAMLEVYQGCYRVLKPQGLMILVTKNFIRNKQEIRLDLDTIRLCEQAGFRFAVRHYRQLVSQSFWRTIYQQKYPDAPILDKEDILVFKKLGREG